MTYKIAIIGAGSVTFSKKLINDLLFLELFKNAEIRLHDIDKSRSTVGALTEFFRNQPGVKRNFQPIFSVAAWGKNKANYLKTGKDSSGKDSIFDKLLKGKGKIVFFGASFQSCTFLHFVEQTQGVPYRHLKTFRGWIKDKQEKYRDECVFLVRNLNQEIIKDTSKLERHLKKKS